MIPLRLQAVTEGEEPFVARLRRHAVDPADAQLVEATGDTCVFAGQRGVFAVDGVAPEDLEGDVVLVTAKAVERLIRPSSTHNTLLVTEQCDQLCRMCSQPPKKTHRDRFALLTEACFLAPQGTLIGITGGEPTLHNSALFHMVETVWERRPDLGFHILSNGQHFVPEDIERLRSPAYRNVCWGIPLYAADPGTHDTIVGKKDAFERLCSSFAVLLRSGARVELRTVVLSDNADRLSDLAQFVAGYLRFIESWSLMQLENIGFARRRWSDLLYDHAVRFAPIAEALDVAMLNDIPARLFNFPICTVPEAYRGFAVASISDWKRKFVSACAGCAVLAECSGFFEWHPDADAERWARPI